jgi:molybdopterin-guanine dinucleotide biosynthesis protein A
MVGAIVGLTAAPRPEDIRRVALALEDYCSPILVFAPGTGVASNRRELPPGTSDLRAVMAVLLEAGREHAAICAGDLRNPSAALIRYMIQIRGSFEVVLPERPDGNLEPLLGLYHPDLVRRAEGLLAAGERELGPLLDLASVRRVTTEEVAKFGDPGDLLSRGGYSSM